MAGIGPSLQARASCLLQLLCSSSRPSTPLGFAYLQEALPSTSGRVFQSAFGLGSEVASCDSATTLVLSRGYKSNKHPLKPLNTAASWKAVEPFLPFAAAGDGGRIASRRSKKPAIVDSCIPEVPEVPKPDVYNKAGVITGNYSLELQKVFAVVEIAGTQFKVTPDDVFFVNQLHGTDINEVLQLNRVMLLGSRSETIVGRPYIPNAAVLVAVEENFRDGKVHVFKRTPRKRYRKYMTTRPHLTTLRVLEIRGIEPAPGDAMAQPTLPVAWELDSENSQIMEAREEPAMLVGKP